MTLADLKELVDCLYANAERDDKDPEMINVIFISQESYPFENSVKGAIQRCEVQDEGKIPQGASPDDIIFVEGSQLRYGSKMFFDAI